MTITRMTFHCAIILLTAAVALWTIPAAASGFDMPQRLWYDEPAARWGQALPIGNGRLGAMVFGGVDKEHLQLNEDTLWSGGPHCYDNPDALNHLPKIRKLLSQGNIEEAEQLGWKLMGQPINQQAFMPLGDLYLTFHHESEPADYVRSLDLINGLVSVRYRIGEVTFQRQYLASHPHQVIAIHLASDHKGMISFDLSVDTLHKHETYVQDTGILGFKGQLGDYEGAQWTAVWRDEGVAFEGRARVVPVGGSLSSQDGVISVRKADAATVFFAAATSFVNYQDISAQPAKRIDACLEQLGNTSFAAVREAHVADFSSKMKRVRFSLGGDGSDTRPTDRRLALVKKGERDPHLIGLIFQYSRYLLLASSRPGTQPAGLQGIWNPLLQPPWGAKYTININTQMNYWQADLANLSECQEPLFDLIRDISKTGAATARTHYGCGGWMMHHNTDIWRGTAPVDLPSPGLWPTGGSWIALHLWEHYLFSQDRAFLRKAYPVLRGSAEFFTEFLTENKDGYLVTSPSTSPEHRVTNGRATGFGGFGVVSAPTMDMEIIRDLFDACVKSGEILGIDEDFSAQLTEMRKRLAPLKVGRYGQLQEWYDDWDNPESRHGHVSHLYGLYPSSQINAWHTPDLFTAAKVSLAERTSRWGGGWPGAWKACLWARCGDGEMAGNLVEKGHTARLADNLLNIGGRFQIDANLGISAAIAEMLLQSHCRRIQLLPALPPKWSEGSVEGLRGRGGFEIGMTWQDARLQSASIKSLQGQPCRIVLPAGLHVTCDGKDVPVSVDSEGLVEFKTSPGKIYKLQGRQSENHDTDN